MAEFDPAAAQKRYLPYFNTADLSKPENLHGFAYWPLTLDQVQKVGFRFTLGDNFLASEEDFDPSNVFGSDNTTSDEEMRYVMSNPISVEFAKGIIDFVVEADPTDLFFGHYGGYGYLESIADLKTEFAGTDWEQFVAFMADTVLQLQPDDLVWRNFLIVPKATGVTPPPPGTGTPPGTDPPVIILPPGTPPPPGSDRPPPGSNEPPGNPPENENVGGYVALDCQLEINEIFKATGTNDNVPPLELGVSPALGLGNLVPFVHVQKFVDFDIKPSFDAIINNSGLVPLYALVKSVDFCFNATYTDWVALQVFSIGELDFRSKRPSYKAIRQTGSIASGSGYFPVKEVLDLGDFKFLAGKVPIQAIWRVNVHDVEMSIAEYDSLFQFKISETTIPALPGVIIALFPEDLTSPLLRFGLKGFRWEYPCTAPIGFLDPIFEPINPDCYINSLANWHGFDSYANTRKSFYTSTLIPAGSTISAGFRIEQGSHKLGDIQCAIIDNHTGLQVWGASQFDVGNANLLERFNLVSTTTTDIPAGHFMSLDFRFSSGGTNADTFRLDAVTVIQGVLSGQTW